MSRFVPSGGNGGGPTSPTFTISETEQRSDKPALSLNLPETTQRSDRIALSPTLPETVNRSDVYRIPTLSITPPETVNRSDAGKFVLTWTATSRSGTPDSDPWGDAYTDASNTGTNHGNLTPVQVANATSLTELRSLFEIDLTRFTGLTPTGNSHTLVISHSSSAVSSGTVTAHFGAQASRWFTESTVTWSNQPATPSLLTKTFTTVASSGTTGTGNTATLTLTDSDLTSLLGKWVLIVFTLPSSSTANAFISSRESGGNPPVLTFTTSR